MEKKLSKKEWVAVAVGLGLIVYTLFGSSIKSLFQVEKMDTTNTMANKNDQNKNGVIIQDIKVGDGFVISKGQTLKVHYILSLKDGTLLQNSKDFGAPFEFVFGTGQVIQGWEMGLEGMKIGGIRTITIPPEYGYGANQAGPIPPNSTLVFTVELLEAK